MLAIAVTMLAGCSAESPNVVSRFDSGDLFDVEGTTVQQEPAISSRSQISLL
jgi:hypothetical protein